MNTHFLKLLIIISLASCINSCSCGSTPYNPATLASPEETKNIKFDMYISHTYESANPTVDKHKQILITIKNTPDCEIIKTYAIEMQLDDLIPQKVSFKDATSSFPSINYPDPHSDITVIFHYGGFNSISIYFSGSTAGTLSQKFKEGSKITVTISGPGYEKCAQTMNIPAKTPFP